MSIEPSRVISMRMALSGFAESWAQCRVVADYVARYSASDRFDAEGLTTRISSFLNEVLELIFANHAAGTMAIDVTREAEAIHIACGLPADAAVIAAFQGALANLDEPSLRTRHREGLLALLDTPSPAGAFIEMAAVHGLAPALTHTDASLVVSLSIPAE